MVLICLIQMLFQWYDHKLWAIGFDFCWSHEATGEATSPGSNKGIVNDPIILTIYATGAPDLTLIDLPGITRVPVKGSDQKDDVEKVRIVRRVCVALGWGLI